MYSEVIKYTDFDGNEQTQKLYFNITKTEIQKENFKFPDGLYGYLKRIIASRDYVETCKYFEHIVDMSYGIKLDNNRFKKSPEILEDFKSSAAYDEWFFKLTTDTEYSTNFINAVLPPEFAKAELGDDEKEKISEDLAIDKSMLD